MKNQRKMKRKVLTLVSLVCFTLAVNAQKSITIEVTNPTNDVRKDQPVVIGLTPGNDIQSAMVVVDGREIPSQLDDLNRDGIYDELCFLADLGKKQTREYTVCFYKNGEPHIYPFRVTAEMLLRNPKVKEKNKHDFFITEISAPKELKDPYHLLHHHGVAFESELIAVRIYFDKRQTLDLYGKKKPRLELAETQFYTTAEQKQEGYGDDVLWVGNTFGLGAMRGWNGSQPTLVENVSYRTQRIVSYGPLRTIVEVEDRGWKADPRIARINMTVRYTLYAGHRDIDVDVFFNRDLKGINFSTGLINVKGSKEFTDNKGVRGCWGSDFPSGANDSISHPRETVGLGIYIPDQYRVSEEPANKDNYAFVVSPPKDRLSYKLAYTSANETFGYKSEKEWFKFLKEWRESIENPIIVKRHDE